MLTLIGELANENNSLPVRNAAAINIKNALVARVIVAYLRPITRNIESIPNRTRAVNKS
jgi:hypothetical protein